MIEERPDQDLANRLSQLRRDLDRVDSVLPAVQERLARATIRPRSSTLPWTMAAAAALLVLALGAIWWAMPDRGKSPTARIGPAAEPRLPVVATIQLGNVELIEHLSLVVDQRAVLVVWSSRGNPRETSAPAATPPGARGASKYSERPLRQTQTQDGRTVTWSLFVADRGVRAVLDPPSVTVSLTADSIISFSTCPKAASRDELHRAIRSITVGGEPGVGVEDIERAIREESNLRG